MIGYTSDQCIPGYFTFMQINLRDRYIINRISIISILTFIGEIRGTVLLQVRWTTSMDCRLILGIDIDS